MMRQSLASRRNEAGFEFRASLVLSRVDVAVVSIGTLSCGVLQCLVSGFLICNRMSLWNQCSVWSLVHIPC